MGCGGGLAAGTFSLIAKICVINGEKYRAHAGVSEYEQSVRTRIFLLIEQSDVQHSNRAVKTNGTFYKIH